MQTFTDNENRRWSLDMTGNGLKRVRKLIGIDLTELEKGDPPLVVRLETDVILGVDVLYALLEPDITKLGLTDEQFGEGLGPEGLKDGQQALAKELADFFLRLGRPDQHKVLTTQRTFMQLVIPRSLSRLERIDIAALLNSAELQADEKLRSLNLLPSGSDLTSSGESSGSTRGLSASGP